MKVKELIEQLQKMPQNYEVIADLHSEYSYVDDVTIMDDLFYNDGYVSRTYRIEDKPKAHSYVHLGIKWP